MTNSFRYIRRANTDWWINEKAIVGMNGKTYIGYMTDTGEIHIKELDAKCSRAESRDVCLTRLNCAYADEHNAPSVCVLRSGRIIVCYTGHNENSALTYRVTQKPYDILSFGPEKHLSYTRGNATYAQIFENETRGEVWLFTRVGGVNWEFRYSPDEGDTWSEPRRIVSSDAGGLFYMNIRKKLIPGKDRTQERFTFALYGHPYLSRDHIIRAGYLESDGTLHLSDGMPLPINLIDNDILFPIEELSVVYASPEGTTVRLLGNAATGPDRVALCTFTRGDEDSAVYHVATFKDGAWKLSAPIAKAGAFLAPTQTDGSDSYVPGMDFYFGVGSDGFTYHGGIIDTDRVYLARKGSDSWLLESYTSRNSGDTYEYESTLRDIPLTAGTKIWRPIVPLYAQDNLPVYWHEGSYSAHTGGWHCNEVLPVEYDD